MEPILEQLGHLETDTIHRLQYAKRLVKGRSRATLIEDGMFNCNFAGYVLVTVVDRKIEAAVYIQDADDWGLELVVSSVKKAERVFDELFHDAPALTPAFTEKLRQYGFVHI